MKPKRGQRLNRETVQGAAGSSPNERNGQMQVGLFLLLLLLLLLLPDTKTLGLSLGTGLRLVPLWFYWLMKLLGLLLRLLHGLR